MLPEPDLCIRIEAVPEGRALRLRGLRAARRAAPGRLDLQADPR